MGVIRQICKFNKQYRKELEVVLLKSAPNLHKLEPKLIQYIYGYINLSQDEISECMRCITNAIAATPDYIITIQGIKSKKHFMPERILRWSRKDIVRDRFSYLQNLTKKMGAPYS